MVQFERRHRAEFSLYMSLVFVLCFPVFATAQKKPRNQEQAEQLWELAIAAKGGRERLHQVNSLVVSYQETVRNFLGLVVHRGPVEQLYVFPSRLWTWDDGLPPPFRLLVRTIDLERDLACSASANLNPPACGKARQIESRAEIDEAQYLYLLETKWIKPAPISVRRDTISFKKVDVVRTKYNDKEIDYYLDRTTHLPRRIAVYRNNSERERLRFDFSEYVNIGGIEMPGKQKKGKIKFIINPDYDEALFIRTPSIAAGPKAWQRVSKACAPP